VEINMYFSILAVEGAQLTTDSDNR
jgi:hypothetical protein